MVPRFRASCYTKIFSEAFPLLRESSPGNILEPALPELRNLVVINNSTDPVQFVKDLHGLKSAIDWREMMIWRDDTREKRQHMAISKSLHKNDVISLQFTRFVFPSNT